VAGGDHKAAPGRRSSVWQTRITSDEGKLMALVTQTQMVFER
jgi:acyl-coenzyme A thioesterase PaaI-like protein